MKRVLVKLCFLAEEKHKKKMLEIGEIHVPSLKLLVKLNVINVKNMVSPIAH